MPREPPPLPPAYSPPPPTFRIAQMGGSGEGEAAELYFAGNASATCFRFILQSQAAADTYNVETVSGPSKLTWVISASSVCGATSDTCIFNFCGFEVGEYILQGTVNYTDTTLAAAITGAVKVLSAPPMPPPPPPTAIPTRAPTVAPTINPVASHLPSLPPPAPAHPSPACPPPSPFPYPPFPHHPPLPAPSPLCAFSGWCPPPEPPVPPVAMTVMDLEYAPVSDMTQSEPLVPDTEVPIITLAGKSKQEVVQGKSYIDPGATAYDAHDGFVDVVVAGLDAVSTANLTAEPFLLAYSARDNAGNVAALKYRQVAVIARCPAPSYYCPDLGLCAECDVPAFGGNISCLCLSALVAETDTVAEYTSPVQDDTAPPRIVLTVGSEGIPAATSSGEYVVVHHVEMLQMWEDPGYSASDTVDGNLTAAVTVFGDVDTAAPTGELPYILEYNVVDAAGNAAATARRYVYVVDSCAEFGEVTCDSTSACSVDGGCFGLHSHLEEQEAGLVRTPPVVDLRGDELVQVQQTERYELCMHEHPYVSKCDRGVRVSDEVDTGLDARVVVHGLSGKKSLNTSVPGVYNISFVVLNSAGLQSEAIRQVEVLATCEDSEPACLVPSRALDAAENAAPNLTLLEAGPVLAYVAVPQHSTYEACAAGEAPREGALCDPGVMASDAEDGDLTQEVLACAPTCESPAACAGYEYANKGILGCLNTSAEVGTIFSIDFVVHDHNRPAMNATATRTVTISSPCPVGEVWCDGVCSPVACDLRDTLLLFEPAAMRHRRLHDASSAEALALTHVAQLQAKSGNLGDALVDLRASLVRSIATSATSAQGLAGVWGTGLKAEMANQANLSASATELQQRAGDLTVKGAELETQALTDLEGERAAASANLKNAVLATVKAHIPAAPRLGTLESEAGDWEYGNLEPPSPPLSCGIPYLDTRSYLFDVPSVVPKATSAPTAAPSVTNAPPDTREEDVVVVEVEEMMDEETATATFTPTTAGPTFEESPLDIGTGQHHMNSSWWPDLADSDPGRRKLLRKGAGGSKRKPVFEGASTKVDQEDSTGSEEREVILSLSLDGFQVPTYLARGANRVVGGMLVELRREERTSAVDFDNKHCTRRFAILGAACRDPSLPTPDKVGLDAVFHVLSDIYNPLVVDTADSYYNLSQPAGQVRLEEPPYFPFGFSHREALGESFPVWIDAGLISWRARQLDLLMQQGHYIDAAFSHLTATIITYQATARVFARMTMSFDLAASGSVLARTSIDVLPVGSDEWQLDTCQLVSLVWAVAVLSAFVFVSRALMRLLQELMEKHRSPWCWSVASGLMVAPDTQTMLLLLLQGLAIGLWYASEVHRLGLDVPMRYKVYDDLYTNGNYLMPAKSSSSEQEVVGPDAAGLAPRWVLKDDEAGLERFLSMNSDLEAYGRFKLAYWGLQMLIMFMFIWQLLTAVNFHQRMHFVMATLVEAFMDDLLYFFLVLGLLATQLGVAGHIMFGDRFETYSNLVDTLVNQYYCTITGEWSLLNPIIQTQKLGLEFTAVDVFVANMYYFMNASLIHLVLLNFLMVILADAQMEVHDGFDSPHSHGQNGQLEMNPYGQCYPVGFFKEIPELFVSSLRTKTVVSKVAVLAKQLQGAVMKVDPIVLGNQEMVPEESLAFKALLTAIQSCYQDALRQTPLTHLTQRRPSLQAERWTEEHKQYHLARQVLGVQQAMEEQTKTAQHESERHHHKESRELEGVNGRQRQRRQHRALFKVLTTAQSQLDAARDHLQRQRVCLERHLPGRGCRDSPIPTISRCTLSAALIIIENSTELASTSLLSAED
ncbi:hypothetical protein CYMTET_28037 [Cymbomonas tetramitiformis]|uniref:Pesticidal crystal protein Cry22Aa Ig-like domain-containing protein n=1 Tax=Cymbomonas tetramitiformis TaxID=36881 RepID=A0AAE0FNS0_9CHLO|nr:hypothetical protein CYMTET_28037 [Cymbomonas tetramitiformis]